MEEYIIRAKHASPFAVRYICKFDNSLRAALAKHVFRYVLPAFFYYLHPASHSVFILTISDNEEVFERSASVDVVSYPTVLLTAACFQQKEYNRRRDPLYAADAAAP